MTQFYFSDLLGEEEMRSLLAQTGAGIESILFSVADNLDDFDATLERERERQERLGHPPLSLHGPFLDLNPMAFDSSVRRVTMARFNQAYEAACVLGADRVVFHSCMIPTVYFLQGWAERMIEFWLEFFEGKSGIQVCMENVLDRQAAPLAEVVRGVGRPDFGICLDVGHAHCYSDLSLDAWLDALGGVVSHVHLHDNDGSHDQHRGLGRGTIDWDHVIARLSTENPAATWTVECANAEEALESWRRWASLAGC